MSDQRSRIYVNLKLNSIKGLAHSAPGLATVPPLQPGSPGSGSGSFLSAPGKWCLRLIRSLSANAVEAAEHCRPPAAGHRTSSSVLRQCMVDSPFGGPYIVLWTSVAGTWGWIAHSLVGGYSTSVTTLVHHSQDSCDCHFSGCSPQELRQHLSTLQSLHWWRTFALLLSFIVLLLALLAAALFTGFCAQLFVRRPASVQSTGTLADREVQNQQPASAAEPLEERPLVRGPTRPSDLQHGRRQHA